MKAVAWPCPAPGGSGEEFALVAEPESPVARVLIVPALFEEANRTRRLVAQTMRGLAQRGLASVLIDLPGCGDSTAPLPAQDLAAWRSAAATAAAHFSASHVLSLRHGVLVAPTASPGWRFEPVAGPLRPLLRARTIAARETGVEEITAELLEAGRANGLVLAGYRLGAAMIRDLADEGLPQASIQADVSLSELGGEALWLRSEPGEDAGLAAALSTRIAADLGR